MKRCATNGWVVCVSFFLLVRACVAPMLLLLQYTILFGLLRFPSMTNEQGVGERRYATGSFRVGRGNAGIRLWGWKGVARR